MAKNKRTKNGQGTIRQLANGKYQCSIETKDALGKRVIKTATADDERTAREKAQKKVEQYIASIAEDNPYNAKLAKEPFEKVMIHLLDKQINAQKQKLEAWEREIYINQYREDFNDLRPVFENER